MTYDITRLIAESLDSYAIVNPTYRKPPKRKDPLTKKIILNQNGKPVRWKPNKWKKWIDLNRNDQVHKYLRTEFADQLLQMTETIIKKFGNALVLWIHGVDDNNLTPDNTFGNRAGMEALIGVGQGNPDSLTANKITVEKLVEALGSNPIKPIKAALAKKGSDYCGRHNNNMNQFFIKKYGLDKVESIQIEIKKTGFRESENYVATAETIANAMSKMIVQSPQENTEQVTSDSADQKDKIQRIKAGDIDLDNGQFKARIDEIDSDSVEFKRLVKSVEIDGVLNNIIVRELSDQSNGKFYQLISGFRRMAALKESKNGADNFETTTVMAKILKASVSNDDAYRISFTENLARKDLSLWEIAQACTEIKKKMEASGKPKGDIDNHIANLIQKDPRTVRRYLKLATIKNKDIQKAVHSGNISPTMALEIGKTDLVKDDPDNISALLNYLDAHPKTTRQFEKVYSNLEFCCECSKMPLPAVLTCKNADDFLSLKKKELEKRVEHLRSKTGKEYTDILKGRAGSLIKETGDIDAGLKKKDAAAEFKKNHKNIVDKINEAFHKSDIDGKFKIKLAPASGDDHVTVTITVPENQVWQAFDAVSGANNSNSGRNVRKGDM